MIYKKYIVLVLLFLGTVDIIKSQQFNADSVILSNVLKYRFIEFEEDYQMYKDSLNPFVKCFCEALLAEAFNKLDKSSNLFEYCIENFKDNVGSQFILYSYLHVFTNSIKAIDKERYKKTYKSFSDYIIENKNEIKEDELNWFKANDVKNLYNRTVYPRSKIVRIQSKEDFPLLFESHPVIPIELNGISCSTILDTGFDSPLVITEDKVSELGLTYTVDTFIKSYRKGKGVLDSLEIGLLKIYNVPYNVIKISPLENLPDSLKNNKEFMQEVEKVMKILKSPIIGLPLLTKIGKIVFNFKDNTVSFPNDMYSKKDTSRHTMFLFEKILATNMEINNKRATIMIDTGSDSFLDLSNKFFQKNKSAFPLQKGRQKYKHISFHANTCDVPEGSHKYLLNPVIKFLNKEINLDKNHIEIKKDDSHTMKDIMHDGQLGYTFLKSLGNKVLIDFDNMNIEILK